MPAAAQASQAYMTTIVPALIPLIVVGVIFFALTKWGPAKAWALVLALILGVILSGTIAGPPIHQFLSQLSGMDGSTRSKT